MSISSTDPSPDQPSANPFATPQSGPPPMTGGVSSLRCEVCGAAIAADQRYCVECGNHRVGINDPAASFMNRSGARAAPRAGRAVVVSSRRGRLTTALMLVLIPVAIAVGILIGRSSNNQDRQLLNAIAKEKAQIVKVQGASRIVTVSGGTAAPSTRTTKKKKAATAGSSTATSTAKKAAGSVGSKSSASQAQQSQKIVKKLQSTNGLSYLNPLPSQVGG